ncbi:isoleucyl-tRNA synthetase [Cavenderia fasciculata]|uniref:isoleucine--tRNA ligase n=1 Tax=Cavenderia fasciculata TaxID=261658 RepID=F4PK84_CACFS|nr:isoleucyl-tRNA synthetase [Cavenderia fasciculata]EGG24008.1 isoleucyl-tRNA synthetase [Cavenderia fasciculata]|eukprot:XP_004361859.1 isoleucyl-tRNA synthetase [Cavenderia fasciculata]
MNNNNVYVHNGSKSWFTLLSLQKEREMINLLRHSGSKSTTIFKDTLLSSSLIRQSFSSASSGGGGADNDHSYSATLNLPKTSFSMKANAQQREPTLLKDAYQLYKWQETNNVEGGKTWVFHDGPPYANGDLHLGHALNKILKDITNRYKMLRGHRVNYIPGWDCHGLPIESKAFESIRREKSDRMTPVEIRKTAKAYAEKEIRKQMASFRSWGIMGDWEAPYITMAPDYEVAQLETFYDMYKRGYVYRGIKPVHWSPSSRTALADAELEYNDNHVSQSIFVKFAVTQSSNAHILAAMSRGDKVHAVIWTTTPWTIPANQAICVNAQLEYSLVKHDKIDNHLLIVSSERLASLRSAFGLDLEVVATFTGAQLEGTQTVHPQYNRPSPVLLGDHVVAGSGSGLVHTAPGHGMEDFAICAQHNIAVLSPVDDEGRFTKEVGDKFVGMEVLGGGNTAVIEDLSQLGCLLHQEKYTHKYPYDWRTKKPILIRTTRQWFVDLTDVHQSAIQAINAVNMVPPSGSNRLSSMVGRRSDWCISRQRFWGVPIPVFYEKETGEALINDETIQHILEVFRKHGGADSWFERDVADLLPEKYRSESHKYVKGSDTMDVWFDSGTSWRGVLVQRGIISKEDGVADIYLEGSDQHRGWFQSSLLTSVCARGIAPYRNVVTHGFLLDEKGMKMSKSLGNTMAPNLIVSGGPNKTENPAYGVDMLRMWVASSDYSRDISIGPNILIKLLENIKKIRNTVKFMLGSNFDFNPELNQIDYNQLSDLDKFALHKVFLLEQNASKYYDQFQYSKAMQELNIFVNEISSFYFDVIKQRLYVESKDNILRRSSQTVLFHMLDVVNKILAPVTVHTSEDIYNHQFKYRSPKESVFTQGWCKFEEQWYNPELFEKWNHIITLRNEVNRLLQIVRDKGVIGRPDEATITIMVTNDQVPLYTHLTSLQSQLEDIFCVSGVIVEPYNAPPQLEGEAAMTSDVLITNPHGGQTLYQLNGGIDKVARFQITCQKSTQHKCPRCWRHQSEKEATLCQHCVKRLEEIKL